MWPRLPRKTSSSGKAPRWRRVTPPRCPPSRCSRTVVPTYAPGSYCGGSRAAAVTSRVLGCPGRAQERRGRAREASESARDDLFRPVVRTPCVGRTNQGPRDGPRSGSPANDEPRWSWSDGARSPPSLRRGTRTRRTRHSRRAGQRPGRCVSAARAAEAVSSRPAGDTRPDTPRRPPPWQSMSPLRLEQRSREAPAWHRPTRHPVRPARAVNAGRVSSPGQQRGLGPRASSGMP